MGNLICSMLIEVFNFRASLQNYKLKKSIFSTHSIFFFFALDPVFTVLSTFSLSLSESVPHCSVLSLTLPAVLSLLRESVISHLYSENILTQGNLHAMSSP